jgi:uncharacterized protein YbjT (DUF2867 family)
LFAITGITGRIGGLVARELLAAKVPVRAIVRDAGRGEEWRRHGCEVAIADLDDANTLTSALTGIEAAFILLPPNFDPAPGFPESRRLVAGLSRALASARPRQVVCLSTVGAQSKHENLLTQLTLLEEALGTVAVPITFLRPAWFLDNAAGDVASATDRGRIECFLQPLDRQIPMVAARDVGATAAALMRETWSGRRIIELAGPQPVSPNDIAASFAKALGHPVAAEAVPRDQWEATLRTRGFKNPTPCIQMMDGFNAGELAFEGVPICGTVTLDEVIASLLPSSVAVTARVD